jgi:putative ABC transport system substrate-binding protein
VPPTLLAGTDQIMRRRGIITHLSGAPAWSLAARAQQPTMPVVGLVGSTSPGSLRDTVAAFHGGLTETGYIEGQNVAMEYRWAEGQYDRLPGLATDLAKAGHHHATFPKISFVTKVGELGCGVGYYK